LIFSIALILLLTIAVILIIVGISILSPAVEDQLSNIPIAQDENGGNFSGVQLAYVSSPIDYAVRAVDPSTKRVMATLNFTTMPVFAIPCPVSGDLYVASGNSLYIVDGKTLSSMVNITYPYPVQYIAFSPDGKRAYVDTNVGFMSRIMVIDTETKGQLSQIPDMAGLIIDGMQASLDGKYLYMADMGSGNMVIVDLHDQNITKKIPCSQEGGTDSDIALSPDGKYIYVSLESSDELAVIDAGNLTLQKTIHMPINNSRSVVASPDGHYVYTTNYDDDKRISTVTVINVSDDAVLKEITIGMEPLSMRISPDGKYLYICTAYDPVQVINTETMSVEKSLGFLGNHVEFSK
jgi:YVTN family beta-propeller protein